MKIDTTATKARALLRDTLVWDNHACMPLRPLDESFLPQLARHKAAGADVVSLNIGFGEQGIEDHVRMAAQMRRWLSLHADDYVLAGTVADIARARAEGKLAVLFDIEGMNAIADQTSLVQLYYDLGVRWMLIAYNRHNRVGGGCQEPDDPGLSAFGRTVLDEMARVGMVTCCSHAGQRTTMDVMAYSRRPVIFSHSNARAVYDHPRNVTDEALRACAATDGVVGINGISIFGSRGGDLVDAFVRHLDHVAQLIGIRHVGLGLDYCFDQGELDDLVAANPETFPAELGYAKGVPMVSPEMLEEITERLLRLGYSDADLRAVLGGNFMRVAQAVWQPPC
jgi:membrane dipeptidase